MQFRDLVRRQFSLETPMKWIFFLFVLAYAALIVISASLGPIDDHELLLSLQIGGRLPFFMSSVNGRFFPLDGQEYNLIALFSTNPVWYYFFNALEFIFFVYLFSKILDFLNIRRSWNYAIIIILTLSPGFVTAWFRLLVPERGVLVSLALFLWSYFHYSKTEKVYFLILALLGANIAFYYKEPVFLMIGAFALSHFIFNLKKSVSSKTQFADILLLASCSLYALVYYILIYRFVGPISYGLHDQSGLAIFIKNLAGYSLNDSLIMFIVFPLVFCRLFQIFVKKKPSEPIYDSLLFASAVYVLVFFKLNLHTAVHYFIPAYVLAIPAIIYFFQKIFFKSWPWKALGSIAALGILFQSIPFGIHLISFYKYVPIHFNSTVEKISKTIQEQIPRKVSLFLYETERVNEREIYLSLARFLEFKKLTSEQFDLKSEIPPLNTGATFIENSTYSALNSKDVHIPRKGDIIILSPFGNHLGERDSLSSTENGLQFKTESPFFVPDVSLKRWIKQISGRSDYDRAPDYVVFIRQ